MIVAERLWSYRMVSTCVHFLRPAFFPIALEKEVTSRMKSYCSLSMFRHVTAICRDALALLAQEEHKTPAVLISINLDLFRNTHCLCGKTYIHA